LLCNELHFFPLQDIRVSNNLHFGSLHNTGNDGMSLL